MADKPDIAKIIGEAATRAADTKERGRQAFAAEEMQKRMIDLHSATFDRAAAYTNVIIVAGYAGAFSLWAFVKEDLSRSASLWVAILLGTSLVTFVIYEVFKMAAITFAQMPQVRMLNRGLQPEEFLREFDRLSHEQKQFSLRWLYGIWIGVMIVTVLSALAAIALLGFNMIFALAFSSAGPTTP